MVKPMSEPAAEVAEQNPMQKVRIEKLTINIAVGKSGEPLEHAAKVLEQLTGKKACRRKAKKTIKTFDIRKGEPIACLVTLRRDDAVGFLKRALEAANNRLNASSFDNAGNLTFGIKEHIEIPGTKYIPEIGIYGMNVSLTLERPGYRVRRRRIARSRIGGAHKLTKQDAIEFMKEKFGVEVVGE